MFLLDGEFELAYDSTYRSAQRTDMTGRVLFVRLSSLGDVVLALSALEVRALPPRVDWVVTSELAPLLRGHPRIGRVWAFDRSTGFQGWRALCHRLAWERYDVVVDLHGSLRSRWLRWSLCQHRWLRGNAATNTKWIRVGKSRHRFWGYSVLKALWPVAWRPQPWVERFARAVGGTGDERPNLNYLARRPLPAEIEAWKLSGQLYVCLMAGSLWPGKRWSIRRFAEVARSFTARRIGVAVLGGAGDAQAEALTRTLAAEGGSVVSGVGRWDLPMVAAVLSGSLGVVGNDTGIAHVAEAVGVPAFTVFGPTAPDLGFGPWRSQSAAFGSDLWCRPCGKDGRLCFRPVRRYKCLDEVEPTAVVAGVAQRLGRLDGRLGE